MRVWSRSSAWPTATHTDAGLAAPRASRVGLSIRNLSIIREKYREVPISTEKYREVPISQEKPWVAEDHPYPPCAPTSTRTGAIRRRPSSPRAGPRSKGPKPAICVCRAGRPPTQLPSLRRSERRAIGIASSAAPRKLRLRPCAHSGQLQDQVAGPDTAEPNHSAPAAVSGRMRGAARWVPTTKRIRVVEPDPAQARTRAARGAYCASTGLSQPVEADRCVPSRALPHGSRHECGKQMTRRDA
jgi:hypothetical protein